MSTLTSTLAIAKEFERDEEWRASPGHTLRAVRMGLGLTLREAATIIGITVVELASWERDKKHVPLDFLGFACRRMAALAIERDRRSGKTVWKAVST